MDYMDLAVHRPRKAVKFNHSLDELNSWELTTSCTGCEATPIFLYFPIISYILHPLLYFPQNSYKLL